jgi:hypothetical protein
MKLSEAKQLYPPPRHICFDALDLCNIINENSEPVREVSPDYCWITVYRRYVRKQFGVLLDVCWIR